MGKVLFDDPAIFDNIRKNASNTINSGIGNVPI